MLSRPVLFTVLVAALGYFVDVYDLIIFSVVRVASLEQLGLSPPEVTRMGVILLNTQLAGMLLGGVFWGVLGDRKGRLTILFGSIFLYSAANICNAFVVTVWQYAACRFFAGLGLAGEIGAGITLVAELLPANRRGIGTTLVATLGVAGGLVAALVGNAQNWQTAYTIGGCLGIALLLMRLTAAESGLFMKMDTQNRAPRGDLRLLLGTPSCLRRYLACTLIGLPLWFIVGLVITFSPEIGQQLGIAEGLTTARAILYFYGALVAGDLASGLLSQVMKSRKRTLLFFIAGAAAGTLTLLHMNGMSAQAYYLMCAATGFFAGYWAVFLTTTSEHFGTNLRATVTTSVPNMVRGGTILLSSAFGLLRGSFGVVNSLEILAALTFAAAFLALASLDETYGIDLDFTEDRLIRGQVI